MDSASTTASRAAYSAHVEHHDHPEPTLSTLTWINIVVTFLLTFGGLFTMMTVAFAAWGGGLVLIGVLYGLITMIVGLTPRD